LNNLIGFHFNHNIHDALTIMKVGNVSLSTFNFFSSLTVYIAPTMTV